MKPRMSSSRSYMFYIFKKIFTTVNNFFSAEDTVNLRQIYTQIPKNFCFWTSIFDECFYFVGILETRNAKQQTDIP